MIKFGFQREDFPYYEPPINFNYPSHKLQYHYPICPTIQGGNPNHGFIDYYDNLPKHSRELISNSNFNLCPACFKTIQEHNPYASPERIKKFLEDIAKNFPEDFVLSYEYERFL